MIHQHPPFLPRSPTTAPDDTVILHLRRDQLVPVTLQNTSAESTGYAEGAVVNTRFGSFPHSTLLNVEWGRQVKASVVDTGRRGRNGWQNKKREVDEKVPEKARHEEAGTGMKEATPVSDTQAGQDAGIKQEQQINNLEAATYELIAAHSPTQTHSLPPSANSKKRPHPSTSATDSEPPQKKPHTSPNPSASDPPHTEQPPKNPNTTPKQAPTGFSHVLPLTPENWTISLPHRTQVVYTPDSSLILQRLRIRPGSVVLEAGGGSGSFMHAAARAVYHPSGRGHVHTYEYHRPRFETLQTEIRAHGLDELVTLTHRDVYKSGFLHSAPSSPSSTIINTTSTSPEPKAHAVFLDLPSPHLCLPHLTRTHPNPLDPDRPVQICAFLPCIEQAQTFISALRERNWVEIRMTNLSHRRLEVRRERTGLDLEGLRGVNASAASVAESMNRLRGLQARDREFRGGESVGESRAERLQRIKTERKGTKEWAEGRLVVRREGEMRGHTSYLVFAVLPRGWGEEEEEQARARWGGSGKKAAKTDDEGS